MIFTHLETKIIEVIYKILTLNKIDLSIDKLHIFNEYRIRVYDNSCQIFFKKGRATELVFNELKFKDYEQKDSLSLTLYSYSIEEHNNNIIDYNIY